MLQACALLNCTHALKRREREEGQDYIEIYNYVDMYREEGREGEGQCIITLGNLNKTK